MIKKFLSYFSIFEWCLWLLGIISVTVSFACADSRDIFSFLSSILGLTSLILMAKGNFIGLIFGIVFAVLYSIFAYTQRYYGEMIIYSCIYLPLKISAIIIWIKNKFGKNKMEVTVNAIKPLEWVISSIVIALITVGCYFLLEKINTDNLIVSTVSFVPSLAATYFMLRRSEYYSICYIFNDIVMVTLWSLKLSNGLEALPSVIAFSFFIVNDLYSFINWRKIKKKQRLTNTDTDEAND